MKKMLIISNILFILVFLFSCSSSPNNVIPPYSYGDYVTMPYNSTDVYYYHYDYVKSHITDNNLSGNFIGFDGWKGIQYFFGEKLEDSVLTLDCINSPYEGVYSFDYNESYLQYSNEAYYINKKKFSFYYTYKSSGKVDLNKANLKYSSKRYDVNGMSNYDIEIFDENIKLLFSVSYSKIDENDNYIETLGYNDYKGSDALANYIIDNLEIL